MSALWLPALVSLFLTTAFEWQLKPRPQPLWRRPLASLLVHFGTWGLQYALWAALVQRPWFAMVIMGSLQMVVIQVSNIKSVSLREPFLCQDFEYFVDAIRHPRLYIPFFGIGLTIVASLAGAAAIVAGFMLEPSLLSRLDASHVWLVLTALAVFSLSALSIGLSRLPTCSLEPNEDLVQLGLYPFLWAYGLLARQPLLADASPAVFTRRLEPAQFAQERLPHVVAVQSESFFDPRRWHTNINRDVLSTYDRLGDEALCRGYLQVPAWGANTVRTECAFLTGLTPEALGVHRFNPYHQLSRRALPNLAGQLRSLGYHTICIHPYPANFYRRDKVFPRLGFETFIDIEAFPQESRDGQYTGDMAIAEKVEHYLAQADDRPLFIFVISMENHGPLHLEQADPAVAQHWYRQPPPPDYNDLTVYLRHLHNADRMLDCLSHALADAERPGLLCWYGDHVPIMPNIYAQLGEPDGLTDYLLWSTQPSAAERPTPSLTSSADALGTTLLDALIRMAGPPALADELATFTPPAMNEDYP